MRCGTKALANVERRNQLRLCVDGNKHPLVANFGSIRFDNAAILFADVSPNLIDLQMPGPKVVHPSVHQPNAVLASHDKQTLDRVAIESNKPLGRADRATSTRHVSACAAASGLDTKVSRSVFHAVQRTDFYRKCISSAECAVCRRNQPCVLDLIQVMGFSSLWATVHSARAEVTPTKINDE
jgi:hypothetical protein